MVCAHCAAESSTNSECHVLVLVHSLVAANNRWWRFVWCVVFPLWCYFKLKWNCRSLFLLEAGWLLFGRTVVHYRHPFTTDQTCFSLVGLVQVYIACVRPTRGFRVDCLGWADISLALPLSPWLCWAEIARVLWVWFAHKIALRPQYKPFWVPR